VAVSREHVPTHLCVDYATLTSLRTTSVILLDVIPYTVVVKHRRFGGKLVSFIGIESYTKGQHQKARSKLILRFNHIESRSMLL
jgi:hypothetical protein